MAIIITPIISRGLALSHQVTRLFLGHLDYIEASYVFYGSMSRPESSSQHVLDLLLSAFSSVEIKGYLK